MPKLLVALLAVAVLAVPLVVSPAAADPGVKAANTLSNVVFGWTNCPKAWADEVSKGAKNPVRGIFGALITGPIMCAVNVAATYAMVPVDILTIGSGDNVLPPAAHASGKPPIQLKE